MEHLETLLSYDVQRVGISIYGDLLAYYRPLFRIAVAIWVISIALDALQSDGNFRPVVWRLLRGSIVLAYLTEPSVARTFAALLDIPDHSSGIIIGHVTGEGGGAASFTQALRDLFGAVNTKSKSILDEIGRFDLSPMPYLILGMIYLFLAIFMAVVVYIKMLATFFQASLIFLLPLAVALYPWSYTRPLFDGLLRQGISFSLITPLLNVLVVMVTSPLLRALDDIDELASLLPFGCLSLAGCLLAWQIPSVAAGVAGGIGLPVLKPRISGL